MTADRDSLLRQLWLEEVPRLRRYLSRKYGEKVGEEATTDAIVRLASRPSLRAEGAERLLWRIALDLAVDKYRRVKLEHRHYSPYDDYVGGGAAPASSYFLTADEALFRSDFLRALRHLPEADRQAFILTELRGLTTREAAPHLGVSHMTVARRAEAARAQLAAKLQ